MAEIDPDLLAILACPKCRSSLTSVPAGLRCTGPDCRLTYPIREGIPVLLIDEAIPLADPSSTVDD